MASATVQRKEPAPPEIVSVTLVLSQAEAVALRRAFDFCSRPSELHDIWSVLNRAGV